MTRVQPQAVIVVACALIVARGCGAPQASGEAAHPTTTVAGGASPAQPDGSSPSASATTSASGLDRPLGPGQRGATAETLSPLPAAYDPWAGFDGTSLLSVPPTGLFGRRAPPPALPSPRPWQKSATAALRPILIGTPAPRPRELPEDLEAEIAGRFPLDGYGDDGFGEDGDNPRTRGRNMQRLPLVVDFPYEQWSDAGTYVHVAAFTPRFAPAAGAEVFLDRKLLGTADERGVFVFALPPRTESVSRLVVRHGNAAAFAQYESFQRTESFEENVLYVYTDRGVYRPGTTLRTRTIAWKLKGEYRPIEHEPLTLALIGPAGELITAVTVTTNAWGIAPWDLALPGSLREGVYRLRAEFMGASNDTTLRVERVATPAIDIGHNLPRYLSTHATRLPVAVRLGYFDGASMGPAELSFGLYEREQAVFEKLATVVGAGPHDLSLTAEELATVFGRIGTGGQAEFRVQVTDRLRRTDTIRKAVELVDQPYRAVIELDKDFYTTGDQVTAIARVSDLDGVPQKNLAVRLSFEEPAATYRGTTNAQGLATIRLRMTESDLWGQLFVADLDNPLTEVAIPWNEPVPMVSRVEADDVLERRAVPITVTWRGPVRPAETIVHADVTDSSGSLIHSFLIPIRTELGQPVARGRFVAPSWGSMLVTLFCLGRDGNGPRASYGLMTYGQSVSVGSDRAISVEFRGLPEKLAPGQVVDARLRLTRQGRPVAAMVGVALVDAALLSLKDPFEIAPSDTFFNPELKVMASTGAKMLTWPVVARNWGDSRYDIALPPFGYLPGELPPEDEDNDARSYKKAPASVADQTSSAALGGGGLGEGRSAAPASSLAGPNAVARRDRASPRGAGNGAEAARSGDVPPTITFRQNLTETALWEPLLFAPDGELPLRLTMPDSITRQTLAVVPSDDDGGVGLGRRDLTVTQPISIRSDLPATMTAGETLDVQLAVRNNGPRQVSATCSLSGPALTVVDESTPPAVLVPAGGTAALRLRVRAIAPGSHRYTVRAVGPGFDDRAEYPITIRPASLPQRFQASSTLTVAGGPARLYLMLPAGVSLTEARLAVAIPSPVPLFAALREQLDRPRAGIDDVSATALATVAARSYLRRLGLDGSDLYELDAALSALLAEINAQQNPDGGFGFGAGVDAGVDATSAIDRRGPGARGSHSYFTGLALEALTAATREGFAVDTNTVRRAVHYLLATAPRDGARFDLTAIAVGEGSTPGVQDALSAELFRVLCDTAADVPALRGAPEFSELRVLAPAFEHQARASSDPRVATQAALGLARLAQLDGVSSARRAALAAAAARLARQRDTPGAPKPSWFSAFGGSFELDLALVRLNQLLADRAGFEAAARDALARIEAHQVALGAWQNTRGTVAALQTLSLLPPRPPEALPTALEFALDGRVFATVPLDRRDPFTSATALGGLDLGPLLHSGDNELTVRALGIPTGLPGHNVIAAVQIDAAVWGPLAAARSDAAEVEVVRTVDKTELEPGDLVQVTLTLTPEQVGRAHPDSPFSELREALPACLRLARETADELATQAGVLAVLRADTTVALRLARPAATEGARRFTYRAIAARRGTCIVPPLTIAAGASTTSVGAATTIVVR